MQTPLNGKKYIVVQRTGFQVYVIELFGAVEDCYVERGDSEGEGIILGYVTVQPQSAMLQNRIVYI